MLYLEIRQYNYKILLECFTILERITAIYMFVDPIFSGNTVHAFVSLLLWVRAMDLTSFQC